MKNAAATYDNVRQPQIDNFMSPFIVLHVIHRHENNIVKLKANCFCFVSVHFNSLQFIAPEHFN